MNFDIVVIGSGPGGYVAAIRASQLGFKVAVVERAEIGGICLNWGCIPTKSLLKSAQVWEYIAHANEYGITVNGAEADFEKIIQRSRNVAEQMSKGIQFLFKKNNIQIIQGTAKLVSNSSVQVADAENNLQEITAKHIILATGARSKQLPNLQQDGQYIIGYRQALTLPKLPQSMIVVGSGAIGTELAYFYNAMGTKVLIVEFLPNIVPTEDEEVSKQLARSLKKNKIEIMTSASVEKVDIIEGQCLVTIKTKKGEEQHKADIVLSAVGITPNIENIGLEELGIIVENGKIKVDEYYNTNIKGVYAIGDIVHGPALAHVASAEAICCVENIAGHHTQKVNYNNIPGAIYTTPEVASVGLTEKKATELGYELKIGKFPFTASGKATAAGNRDGFVKLIFNAQNGELLGAHLIGLNVTEMIAELVVAKTLETTAQEIIKSIHPHPTMAEAIMEAAAAAYQEAIHI